jgi:predicted secreted protein with PEFG-CTERM motif
MDTSVVGDNKKFVFNVIFNETFDTSNVLVRAWDAYQHISMIYLFDSFKVVPAIISESTPITDESLDTEIIDIPVDISESVSDDAIISSEDIQNDMESVLPYSIMISGAKDVIPYDITGGAITGSIINLDNNSIVLNLSADDDGTLTISPSESTQSGIFMVLVDGEEANDAEIDGNTVTIPFLAGTETIEIIGTFVIPEFGTIAMMILLVSIVSIIAISAKSRLSIIPRY